MLNVIGLLPVSPRRGLAPRGFPNPDDVNVAEPGRKLAKTEPESLILSLFVEGRALLLLIRAGPGR